MNKFSNYVKKIKTKIQQTLWLYGFIKAFVRFTKPIIEFIFVLSIIVIVYNLLQIGSTLAYVFLFIFLGLQIILFLLIWLKYYFDLIEKRNLENTQKRKKWFKDSIDILVETCYEDLTPQQKEAQKYKLLKKLGIND